MAAGRLGEGKAALGGESGLPRPRLRSWGRRRSRQAQTHILLLRPGQTRKGRVKEGGMCCAYRQDFGDVRRLEAAGHIPTDLAGYLDRKMRRICEAVDMVPPEEFSLETHGPIGIVEKGDRSLTALGLPESLDLVMPEWVSKLELASCRTFWAYFCADNDHVPIAVVPESIACETILAWLSEQPMEEETDDRGGEADRLPEPF